MQNNAYTLTIAGLDPCGGAGILADIKTMEAHGVIGMSVCTAITYQNDTAFRRVDWITVENIIAQIEILLERFQFSAIKIGLIESYEVLIQVLSYLRSKLLSNCFILWDPILKASAGFNFHAAPSTDALNQIARMANIITPNQDELKVLLPSDTENKIRALSEQSAVLLKGGHLEASHSNDILISNNEEVIFTAKRLDADKRGTGCVLSSAIISNVALGLPLEASITKAKQYVEKYLVSSQNRLGFHYA
jgi:hydroxymethylpyrimidine/phosphomethylpyrimidine kinase